MSSNYADIVHSYVIVAAANIRADIIRTNPDGYEEAIEPAALSRYLSTTLRERLDAAERALADVLPPIKVARDIDDQILRAEVETWRARMGYDRVDVSELRGEGETPACDDPEAWQIVRGSSRFEVREVPRYEARRVGGPGNVEGWHVHDNETNADADDNDAAEALGYADVVVFDEEQARACAAWLNDNAPGRDPEPCWIVWDTENNETMPHDMPDYGVEYDPTDESSAIDAAERANVEDYHRENACGWPWAHNYGVTIERHDVDDFDAAGFVVAEHTPSGQLYAGIDGGGYDFMGAHWLPLYLARAARNGWYVRTRDGLRRVEA